MMWDDFITNASLLHSYEKGTRLLKARRYEEIVGKDLLDFIDPKYHDVDLQGNIIEIEATSSTSDGGRIGERRILLIGRNQ